MIILKITDTVSKDFEELYFDSLEEAIKTRNETIRFYQQITSDFFTHLSTDVLQSTKPIQVDNIHFAIMNISTYGLFLDKECIFKGPKTVVEDFKNKLCKSFEKDLLVEPIIEF